MATYTGILLSPPDIPDHNPYITNDLENLGRGVWLQPPNIDYLSPFGAASVGTFSQVLPINVHPQSFSGMLMSSNFDDYYYRIWVSPAFIDLGTVASSQSRSVTVWDAYPYTQSDMDAILISDPVGTDVVGPATPLTMNPLQLLTYNIVVGTSGAPAIDVYITFDFADIEDPAPVHIVGTRAVRFDNVPEVPVQEDWTWLTDVMTSTDGTEQRVACRGTVPRTTPSYKVIFDNADDINAFQSQMTSAQGRLWIPEYQYATIITADAAIGALALTYDNTRTDVRDGEYVLISTKTSTFLIQLGTLTGTGASLAAALTSAVPKGSLIVPGSPAVVDNKTSLGRYLTNYAAQVTVNSTLIRNRTSIQRQGASVTLTSYKGTFVLDRRPLMSSDTVDDAYDTGQIDIDNDTGLKDIIVFYDETMQGGNRDYFVPRVRNPAELDYWKCVLETACGKVKKFWVPTYRNDLPLAAVPPDSATALSCNNTYYAERYFTNPIFREIEIETASGIVRTTVTAAASVAGTSSIVISPGLPAGAGYRQISRISFLLPMRFDDDKFTWKHYPLESILTVAIRTVPV